ncbi:MAG: hypothetical protein HY014_10050 [Acidobacteria bacterium]|nr:hypothetical protein [Acidobacteriota bacterium]MBI3488497.1 hypothetical protein [Acidobacteriota bacterium]
MSVGSIGGVCGGAQACTDPRDLNRDGKVTEAEVEAYGRLHPKPKPPEESQAQGIETRAHPVAASGGIDLSV